MGEQFTIRYRGDHVDKGSMDAFEVADAIRGFGTIANRASALAFGGDIQVGLEVRGFRQGSLDIQILFNFLSENAAIFSSTIGAATADNLVAFLKESFSLLKHLGGSTPKTVRKADRNSVYVENNNGTVLQCDNLTVKLVSDPAFGRAASDFVRQPLTKSAREVQVLRDKKVLLEAKREDADSYRSINADDVLVENTSDIYLTIQTAVLEGNRRWRFSDGRSSFLASIEDEDFLRRIEIGRERFGHGDTLRVRMRAIQKIDRGRLRAEYVIEQVLEHQSATGRQPRLL